MKKLHFDCVGGISGDMTLAALLDAGADLDAVNSVFVSLQLPITLETETVKRCGIRATKVNIIAEDQEDYRFLPDVEAILNRSSMTAPQRELAWRIFRKVAEAEARVHGIAVEKVHFHEVGALDSIADIVGVAVAFDSLGITSVSSSSVPTGSGTVKCAHGLMPIPAPATLELLKGIPLAKSAATYEQTTPTGAAILATLATEFTDTPEMTVTTIGIGAGTKDPLDKPNILRVLLGTENRIRKTKDAVVLLETNLDDCPGEVIGYAIERLFAAGALDVFTIPIQMKKHRPGVILSVIASETHAAELESILFRETGTFGIRKTNITRSTLEREIITVSTEWGDVRVKHGWRAGHEVRSPEYEDCARIARERNLPLAMVYNAVRLKAANEKQ